MGQPFLAVAPLDSRVKLSDHGIHEPSQPHSFQEHTSQFSVYPSRGVYPGLGVSPVLFRETAEGCCVPHPLRSTAWAEGAA